MTDYYSIVEDAIITLLRTLDTFDNDWQVSQADDNVLSRGADYFALVRPSTFGSAQVADRDMRQLEFGTELYIYVRYKNEQETSVLFREIRSDVLNLLLNNPTLSNANWVQKTTFDAGAGIGYLTINDMPNTPPAFMMQQIDIKTTQLIPVTRGEYE